MRNHLFRRPPRPTEVRAGEKVTEKVTDTFSSASSRPVVPAKSRTHFALQIGREMDSGSPLRCGRNDGGKGVCHLYGHRYSRRGSYAAFTIVLIFTRSDFFNATRIADRFSIVGLPEAESMR